jgi:predicted Zn-dependent protease
MRRWLSFGVVIGALTASLVVAERRNAAAPAGAGAILTVVGSAERGATRIPVRLTRVPDADEISAGDEIAAALLARQPASAVTPADACVQRVGARLAGKASRRQIPYRFHLLRDPDLVNAFAVPGGHVFIGQGLVALMTSEDELAAVLGHEIAHVDDYHAAEWLQTRRALGAVPIAGALASIPIDLIQAGYSKNQELEADRDGTALAVAAGYSPTGATRMLDELATREPASSTQRSRSPEGEAGAVATDLLAGYFRGHPYPMERAAAIRRLMVERGWAPHEERPLGL